MIIIHICGSYESPIQPYTARNEHFFLLFYFFTHFPNACSFIDCAVHSFGINAPNVFSTICVCVRVCLWALVSFYSNVSAYDICMRWSIWYTIRACMYASTRLCVFVCTLAYLYGAHKKNYALSVYWMGKQNGMPNKILWTHISFVMHETHSSQHNTTHILFTYTHSHMFSLFIVYDDVRT